MSVAVPVDDLRLAAGTPRTTRRLVERVSPTTFVTGCPAVLRRWRPRLEVERVGQMLPDAGRQGVAASCTVAQAPTRSGPTASSTNAEIPVVRVPEVVVEVASPLVPLDRDRLIAVSGRTRWGTFARCPASRRRPGRIELEDLSHSTAGRVADDLDGTVASSVSSPQPSWPRSTRRQGFKTGGVVDDRAVFADDQVVVSTADRFGYPPRSAPFPALDRASIPSPSGSSFARTSSCRSRPCTSESLTVEATGDQGLVVEIKGNHVVEAVSAVLRVTAGRDQIAGIGS